MDQKKIAAVVIVIIAVIGMLLGFRIFWQSKNNPVTPSLTESPVKSTASKNQEPENKTGLPETTGNAEDITGGIASQMVSEEEKFSGEDEEAQALSIDAETLNDFGQSYDENEF